MTKKSQKARAAARTARAAYTNPETHTFLTSNDLIREAIGRGYQWDFLQLLAARYTAKLDFFHAPPTDLPVSPNALNTWLRERRKFQRQAVTTLCLDICWTGYGRLTMLIGQLSDGAKLKPSYLAWQVVGDKLYERINCDYDPMAVENFDKDIYVFFEFVKWVSSADRDVFNSGRIKILITKTRSTALRTHLNPAPNKAELGQR